MNIVEFGGASTETFLAREPFLGSITSIVYVTSPGTLPIGCHTSMQGMETGESLRIKGMIGQGLVCETAVCMTAYIFPSESLASTSDVRSPSSIVQSSLGASGFDTSKPRMVGGVRSSP